MRTTINIDDALLERAIAITGIEERAKLINVVLEKFVASESAKRLKKLAGKAPDFSIPSRSSRTGDRSPLLNEDPES